MQTKSQCRAHLLIKVLKKVAGMIADHQVMQVVYPRQVRNQENKAIKKKERNWEKRSK